jgi:5-methylcytosine-specific restriction endonuclease McrA
VARQRAIAEARRRQAAHEAELSAKYPGWDYYAIQQYEALRGRVEREQEAAERQRPVAYIRAELKNDGDLRWRIFARDSYTCQQCGAAGGKAELTIDHITPVSRGGTNAETNLQTLCRSCNSRKGARV